MSDRSRPCDNLNVYYGYASKASNKLKRLFSSGRNMSKTSTSKKVALNKVIKKEVIEEKDAEKEASDSAQFSHFVSFKYVIFL